MRPTLVCISILLASVVGGRGDEAITLHDYHPFRAVPDISAWDSRKADIRTRVLVGSGLLPLPEKTPLNARRFGAVERDGFRVERVYFESFPGHYVTGSLFLPTGESEKIGLIDGKRPAILCPHGHWKDGRFYDALGLSGERGVREQISIGAERFETAARNPVIARCVQLARMGCIAFSYDMLGNADSIQLVDHRRGPRESMNSAEFGKWGFVSPQATLYLQTNFGLQTWNSVRALDFLLTLDGVDPDRLGVTGASGGGTQTMVVAAIDERIDASFPCVMPSTAMQGGCTCENTHYLRIDQGNMDIAAALAPKPLGMTAADDWTIELETKGYPDLVSLYERLKAPKNFEAHFNIHFKHNYNHVSREQMYQFVNRHFQLGLESPVLEQDFEYLGKDDLSVWANPADKPEGYVEGDDHERALNQVWADDANRAWNKAKKKADSGDMSAISDWVADGWTTILRPHAVRESEPTFELVEKEKDGEMITMKGRIEFALAEPGPGYKSVERAGVATIVSIPTTIYYPANWNGEVVIQLGEQGSNELIEWSDKAVICLDLVGQNGREPGNSDTTYSGKADIPEDSWQRSPVYYYGYNDSTFVRRAQEVAAAVFMAERHPDWDVKNIVVRGEGGFAAIAHASQIIAGGSLDEVEGQAGDFTFSAVNDLWDDFMVPGALKYGGAEGLELSAKLAVKE